MLYLEWSERLTANMGLLTTNAAGATHWLTASPIRYAQLKQDSAQLLVFSINVDTLENKQHSQPF